MIVLISALLPVFLWSVIRLGLSGSYEMDPGGQRGAFHLLLPYYHKFFYTMVMLSFAGAVGGWYLDLKLSVDILPIAGMCALLFNGLLLYFYEGFLSNPKSYGRNKYALILALGWSSFLLFITGVVSLVVGAGSVEVVR